MTSAIDLSCCSSVLPLQLQGSQELSYGASETNSKPAPIVEVIPCSFFGDNQQVPRGGQR
ncbi:MAG: hypothetical protein V3U88_00110 [Methylococcales bacterium]